MLFIIAISAASAFSVLLKKPIKQLPYVFYAAAAIVSIAVIFGDFSSLPRWVNTYIVGLFTRGAFSTALWCIVMWTGAFPNGSKPIKILMPIRGELSILACILTLGHNIGYGKTYFRLLFTDISRMSDTVLTACILTIMMMLIMLPLTVMSFPQVRRKMKPKLWKRIQRSAYLFYALIYMHVMVLTLPLAKAGRSGYRLSVWVYSLVFLGYAVCRIRKWYIVRKKPETQKMLNAVCVSALAVIAAIPCVYASIGTTQRTVSADKDAIQATTISAAEAETETQPETAVPEETETTAVSAATEAVNEMTEPIATESNPASEEAPASEAQAIAAETVTVTVETEAPVVVQTEPQPTSASETAPVTEPATEPEPVYLYQNGTYTASAYGYDGKVEVTVTIENDQITAITGTSYESDTWYYDSAAGWVIPQILDTQNSQVDAFAGATYSSNAIMTAVQNALNMARK